MRPVTLALEVYSLGLEGVPTSIPCVGHKVHHETAADNVKPLGVVLRQRSLKKVLFYDTSVTRVEIDRVILDPGSARVVIIRQQCSDFKHSTSQISPTHNLTSDEGQPSSVHHLAVLATIE